MLLGALAAAHASCDVLLESKEVVCLGADRLHGVLLGVGVHITSSRVLGFAFLPE